MGKSAFGVAVIWGFFSQAKVFQVQLQFVAGPYITIT